MRAKSILLVEDNPLDLRSYESGAAGGQPFQ